MPRISELPAASAMTGAEIIPIVQDGTTKKLSAAQLATAAQVANAVAAAAAASQPGHKHTDGDLDGLFDVVRALLRAASAQGLRAVIGCNPAGVDPYEGNLLINGGDSQPLLTAVQLSAVLPQLGVQTALPVSGVPYSSLLVFDGTQWQYGGNLEQIISTANEALQTANSVSSIAQDAINDTSMIMNQLNVIQDQITTLTQRLDALNP